MLKERWRVEVLRRRVGGKLDQGWHRYEYAGDKLDQGWHRYEYADVRVDEDDETGEWIGTPVWSLIDSVAGTTHGDLGGPLYRGNDMDSVIVAAEQDTPRLVAVAEKHFRRLGRPE